MYRFFFIPFKYLLSVLIESAKQTAKMESSAIQIVVVSTEIIKPSKPTPSHLRTFKLSLLDQLIPNPYAPIILFYPPNDVVPAAKKLHSLKTSLSETLARYYPLAGKIGGGELSIDCNDQGARFVEAKVGSSLRQFLAEPGLISSLNGLLPCELAFEPSTEYVTNVQASVFDCGGVAVGLCISHKLLDGVALSAFLQSWSATCRGDCEDRGAIMTPCLDAANSLFPANDLWLRGASMETFGAFFAKGKCVTKRFVFVASAISRLKAKATTPSSSSTVRDPPTRVEAVSAFIWKCVAEASKESNGRHALSTHVVNLRRRTTPPLPSHAIGNLIWIVSAKSSVTGDVAEFSASLRDSFSKIDADFVENLRGEGKGSHSNHVMAECLAEIGELGKECDGVHVGFSSWCKCGFYEVEFGWGRPAWVSSVGLSGSEVFMRLVILVDTRLGDGIEAWLSLDERDMAVVERNPELVELAQVDPNPF